MAEREWFDKDYYKVLGLTQSATDKEVTRAYRKLAKEYHPDTNPGSEERFKEISSAYDVLGDAAKRKEYDEVRRLGPVAGGVGGGPGGFNFTTGDFTDLGDLFGSLFGGRRPRTQR
ncbi:MAG: molecular chaperone DnaJ, partial [Actinobacteria bacterium 21-73-9]